MNKQAQGSASNFSVKLQSCSDELSLLLDLIYKFPQQQRQRYYDRIQLLKQNMAQLKISSSSAQSLPSSLERKYQQIFIKLNELKAEVNSYELSLPAKRKKGQCADAPPLLEAHQLTCSKPRTGPKTDYDQIMETIVQKDEEVKKCKLEVESCRKILKQFEDRQLESKRFYENLQKEVCQIQNISSAQAVKTQSLQQKIQQLSAENQALSNACTSYKESAEFSSQEVLKLESLLSEATENCKMRRIEAESYMIQLAALEEKSRYDAKSYAEREEAWRMKERDQHNRIADLEKLLLGLTGAEEKKQELLVENGRLKEDLKVLQAELVGRQAHMYEKNRKLETNKAQIQHLNSLLGTKQKEIQQRQGQLERLLRIEKQNQDVILILERKTKQLEHHVAVQQQARILVDRKLTRLEQDKSELQTTIEKHRHQLRISQASLLNKGELLEKLTLTKKDLEQQLQSCNLERVKAASRIEELNRIIAKVSEENIGFQREAERAAQQIKNREEGCKKHDREIESLKKRLTRAKIEAIHNLRQNII